jgi:hypothetical protein
LEKIQNKINLQIFEYLINSIYEELSKFDPENIEYNIYKIQNMVISLQESEKELTDISNNVNVLKKIWKGFVNRYPEIKNTKLEKNFYMQLDVLMDVLAKSNITQVGLVEDSLTNLKKTVEEIILLYEKLKEYEKYHLFIGEEYEEFYKELQNIGNLISESSSDLEDKTQEEKLKLTKEAVEDFIIIVKEYIEKIEKIKKEESTKGVIKIPVIKAQHKINKNIYKFTVKFEDFLLKYESFFLNEKALNFTNTKQYIFIDNYPIKGIFKADETIKNLKIFDNYILAATEYDKSIFNLFIFISVIDILSGFFVIGNTFLLFFYLFYVFGSLFSLRFFKKVIYKFKENKYKVKKFFPFIKTDFIIFKTGEDLNVNDILLNIIREIDNTILNKKFQKNIKKYVVFYKKEGEQDDY